MSKHFGLYFLMIWMGAIPLLASVSIAATIINYESFILNFRFVHWLLFFLAAIFTMALAITPTTFIALISGYFLGFDGLIPIVVSYQAASILGYTLASKLDSGFLNLIKEEYPKSQSILKNVGKNQFGLTILVRLSPALPFAIMNVILSITKIRFKHFFLGGLVGMLPRTILFVWIGIQASKLSEAIEGNENIYLTVGISLVVIFVILKIVKK